MLMACSQWKPHLPKAVRENSRSTIAVGENWALNFPLSQVYGAYLMFACLNVFAAFFCACNVFETKGLTKAEIKEGLVVYWGTNYN